MTTTLLLPGEYIIPDGHTVIRKGLNVTIRPIRRKTITDSRCEDCQHFGCGKATRGGWRTTVCFERPKSTPPSKYDSEPLYYHVSPKDGKRCPMFEPKNVEL